MIVSPSSAAEKSLLTSLGLSSHEPVLIPHVGFLQSSDASPHACLPPLMLRLRCHCALSSALIVIAFFVISLCCDVIFLLTAADCFSTCAMTSL